MLARLKLGHNQFFERGPPSPPPRSQLGKAFNNFNSFPSGPQGRLWSNLFYRVFLSDGTTGQYGYVFFKGNLQILSGKHSSQRTPSGFGVPSFDGTLSPFVLWGGPTGIHFVRPPLTRGRHPVGSLFFCGVQLKGANLFPVFFTLWMFGCILGLYLLVETPVFH